MSLPKTLRSLSLLWLRILPGCVLVCVLGGRWKRDFTGRATESVVASSAAARFVMAIAAKAIQNLGLKLLDMRELFLSGSCSPFGISVFVFVPCMMLNSFF